MESPHDLKIKGTVPLLEEDQIKFMEKRFAYIILSRDSNITQYPHLKISQKLTFLITEIDVESKDELGEYDEEFTAIQDVIISTKDYIKANEIANG